MNCDYRVWPERQTEDQSTLVQAQSELLAAEAWGKINNGNLTEKGEPVFVRQIHPTMRNGVHKIVVKLQPARVVVNYEP